MDSIVDYQKSTYPIYLLQNKIIKDSIVEDFTINSFQPIPLATENEAVFMIDCIVPESDVFWNSLLGIDILNYKFKIYQRNRIIR